jgi:alkanesulfonate monooxygenase SsuD/methylene tetrahydromethanopterin reductase-like flavin-dependent oxidoreductase (luciferase family)
MKYGLYVPNFGAFGDARLLGEMACTAEQAGWDGFFIWDHIARSWTPPVTDTWVALSAIALNTTRIRFGPLVTPLPRRRPGNSPERQPLSTDCQTVDSSWASGLVDSED